MVLVEDFKILDDNIESQKRQLSQLDNDLNWEKQIIESKIGKFQIQIQKNKNNLSSLWKIWAIPFVIASIAVLISIAIGTGSGLIHVLLVLFGALCLYVGLPILGIWLIVLIFKSISTSVNNSSINTSIADKQKSLLQIDEKFKERKSKFNKDIKELLQQRDQLLLREKEIERRKTIVEDIATILYKDTEKEVNITLIPTLINELHDIFTGLHSESMEELVINGSLEDFQNITDSIKSELSRLKKLALEAQTKGYYTDEETEYENSIDSNGIMTKERAFIILGLEQTASKEEIKKTYKILAHEFHPDKAEGATESIKKLAEEKFKEIKTAYEFLIK